MNKNLSSISFSKIWKNLGPGLVTGASDDDPSGIATYSQAGAKFGFQFLWLSIFTFPLMAIVQEMCARIGLVSGKGLTKNIKENFSRPVLYFIVLLFIIANTFNLAADLGAMASVSQLLLPSISFVNYLIIFAFISLLLQIFLNYQQYSKYLKYLAFSLLSYIVCAIFVNFNWSEVLYFTFLPTLHFSKSEIFLVCAILGTTISPYLFFWQSDTEVEEKRQVSKQIIKNMRSDIWSGMFFSNLIMFFIILICGATLYKNGVTNIETVKDTAEALRPFAGNFAYLLFALGVIGTGLLAVPILSGSIAYAVCESLDIGFGLNKKWWEAKIFYGIIVTIVFLGVILNLFSFNPINMLIYSAVLNGIIAPFILYFIVSISSSSKVMGAFTNSTITKFFGWLTIFLMAMTSIAAVFSIFL